MNQNNMLPLEEGAEMTAKFRVTKESILAEEFRKKGILPTCETFDRQAFDTLLSNNEVKAVRIYSSMDETTKIRFIIVGVNDAGGDVYIDDKTSSQQYVIEVGIRCPDVCPPASVLNG